MTGPSVDEDLEALWARHHAEWRDLAQVTSQWQEAAYTDPTLLQGVASGDWWDVLRALRLTLLISREYEHLIIAMTAQGPAPEISYLRMPHPSGIAADRERQVVHVASTRNPNQIFELVPLHTTLPRQDVRVEAPEGHPLVAVRSTYYPGCLYLHDLALFPSGLHANAVGENAVVRLSSDGAHSRVWWPRSIGRLGAKGFGRNLLQLNSIAAGPSLQESYFSASAAEPGKRRPGQKNFPVDKRGVIFAGETGEPCATGLTRPHSARLNNGRIWVDNSGYGELGTIADGRFEAVARLQGWTRGLTFFGDVAFVGTSRVIPKYSHYAPGLDVGRSVCGVHAVSLTDNRLLGSYTWPLGNQIFAIEWLPASMTSGFLFKANARNNSARQRAAMYAFSVKDPAADTRPNLSANDDSRMCAGGSASPDPVRSPNIQHWSDE